MTESIAAANAAELLNDKVILTIANYYFINFIIIFVCYFVKTLKRVSSYPAATAQVSGPHKDPAQVVKPRRHEQTQSQHDSVEASTEFTLSIDPSNTSVNSREPLISSSCVSTMGTIG